MDVQSVSKYLRMSPEKAREVGRLLQGKPVPEALDLVALIPRKAARCFEKTLKSAVANAENNLNLKREDLRVKEATVGPGPIIKRFQPKARGMAGRIRKRTSHFTVVVTDQS
jgi:large subunit ribosomal protein L22